MAAKKQNKKTVTKKRALAKRSNRSTLSLEDGLKYPWVHAGRQWNVLWLLIPIFGWLAIGGYIKKLLGEIARGKINGLPKFGNFWQNLADGFFLFLYMIPLAFIIVLIGGIGVPGQIVSLLAWLLLFPYMFINVIVEDTFTASFQLKKWWRVVITGNFGEYIIALIKTIIYGVAYGLLSLIIIGIPGNVFGKNIFIADFYAKYK